VREPRPFPIRRGAAMTELGNGLFSAGAPYR
jgi:hypothetical protein